ncbi:hypothetical protein VRB21_01430 [Pseudomonas poae]
MIELQATLASLITTGITPLKLAEEIPADGVDILALTAPEWDTLHLAACTQQASRELVEQPFVWRVTMKNQCEGVALGGFGGPLLDRASNRLFGILSTSTRGQPAERKCQRDAPCEVNNGIPVWQTETNYGSPITFLNQCFVGGVLQTDGEHCELYPTTSITFKTDTHPAVLPQESRRQGQGHRAALEPALQHQHAVLSLQNHAPSHRLRKPGALQRADQGCPCLRQ